MFIPLDKISLPSESIDVIQHLSQIEIDNSWAFVGATRKDTGYISHAYHSYPAKFIPQLAGRLIEAYSQIGDIVVDPFAGCGTTLVEAKVRGRMSIGTDINPVATLITSAKINALSPLEITESFHALVRQFARYDDKSPIEMQLHERLDFWYRPQEKHKLAFLHQQILLVTDEEHRIFFLCAFSNILKSCSIWMQKSNKPTRDMKKIPADPFVAFQRQVKAMLRGNYDYHNLLKTQGFLDIKADIHCQDARQSPALNNSVSLVVTSPPYVTSYEYADLHQLPALWFTYTDDLAQFRKQFIGTAYHYKGQLPTHSPIAEWTYEQLMSKNRKSAEEVAHYFGEMFQVFSEMHRILKVSGKICVVIGNTALHKVDILNAEVFIEQLQALGMRIVDIIKREIPSKNLPSVRDENTGRFAKITDDNLTYAYPTEYILVMEKK
jgi:DNA modification methylase